MSLPYFPLYPRDFEADTSHLTLEEDGAYNRLLRLCWMTPGCSLPDDDAWIMRRMRCDAETYERVVKVVLEEFFTRSGGRVSNARLTRESATSNEKHQRRVEAGAKGGKAKAAKTNEKPPSNAKAMPKQPEPEPEPEVNRDTNVSLGLSAPEPSSALSAAVQVYNNTAGEVGWPKVQKLTPARSKALRARLADCGGIEGWRMAMDKGKASDFLCGRTNKAWAGCGFDWLTKQANFTKLMEGNYDNRDNNQGARPAARRQDRPDPALEQISRLAGLGQASGNGGG